MQLVRQDKQGVLLKSKELNWRGAQDAQLLLQNVSCHCLQRLGTRGKEMKKKKKSSIEANQTTEYSSMNCLWALSSNEPGLHMCLAAFGEDVQTDARAKWWRDSFQMPFSPNSKQLQIV